MAGDTEQGETERKDKDGEDEGTLNPEWRSMKVRQGEKEREREK